LPRLAVLSVLPSASSPCPDLNLIHYKEDSKGKEWQPIIKRSSENSLAFQTTFYHIMLDIVPNSLSNSIEGDFLQKYKKPLILMKI